MSKPRKAEVAETIKTVERFAGNTRTYVNLLPDTPGQLKVLRGLEQVREGISEIRKEAEVD